MPCDVCGHTVQNIGSEGLRKFWCARCGTIIYLSGTAECEHREVESPALVRRVRALLDKGIPAIAAVCSATSLQYDAIVRDLKTLAESVMTKTN